MEENKVYTLGTNKRLKINDNSKFLQLLSETDNDTYMQLKTYGKKIMNARATDVPFNDQDAIINWAILKARSGYDPECGSNFLTYFNDKLRGEISDFRAKKNSMVKKIQKMVIESTGDYVVDFDQVSQQNTIDEITIDTPETILIAEDMYYRKLQAFRMAFSGIPKYSQYILNQIVDSSAKLKELSTQEEMSAKELTRIRNHALSLILSRVLRSNHLTEDEKDEIKKEHGLV
jgi:hypothetical protein